MKLLAAAFATICMTLTSPLWAQSNPVVVELFTSQGCSSCPPADAIMRKLAKRDDVIPLALHVDYWDYIGWKDEFANPANTVRQKKYAHVAGRKMIYTPQMIVNGQEDVVGAHAMELLDLIAQHKAAPARVDLVARREEGAVFVQVQPLTEPVTGPLVMYLVQYSPLQSVHITRGENAGRDLEYANVVTGWTKLGSWDGKSQIELQSDLDGDHPAVVLVQQPGAGAIVAAARVK